MGLFSGKHKRKNTETSAGRNGGGRRRAKVVRVRYLAPGLLPKKIVRAGKRGGYAYAWRLPEEPQLGDVVDVSGAAEGVPAQVVGFGRGDWDGPLESVTRLLTAREVLEYLGGDQDRRVLDSRS